MDYNSSAFLVVIGLFVGALLMLTLGQYLGRRNSSTEMDSVRTRLTTVEAAVFGLLGLMIAFTFSGAAGRYELRRQQVVDEANAIGTAYLRLDLLPVQIQPVLREQFRRYAQARVSVFQVMPDFEASQAHALVATELQQDIWAGTMAALKESPPHATIVVIPALNQMFDVTTSRAMAMRTHTPVPVFATLIVLALVCALLAGYALTGSRTRYTLLHVLSFAIVLTGTIYVIFDLDYPRYGFIRLDFADQAMLNVLGNMKEPSGH